jgi:hypothetical protein
MLVKAKIIVDIIIKSLAIVVLSLLLRPILLRRDIYRSIVNLYSIRNTIIFPILTLFAKRAPLTIL